MEFKFTRPRVLFLIVFLAIFYAIGGFEMPEYAKQGNQSAKAWLGSVLLFCGGAVCTTIVDHFAGNIERTNLRAVYVIIGVILMIVATLWVKALAHGDDEH